MRTVLRVPRPLFPRLDDSVVVTMSKVHGGGDDGETCNPQLPQTSGQIGRSAIPAGPRCPQLWKFLWITWESSANRLSPSRQTGTHPGPAAPGEPQSSSADGLRTCGKQGGPRIEWGSISGIRRCSAVGRGPVPAGEKCSRRRSVHSSWRWGPRGKNRAHPRMGALRASPYMTVPALHPG